MACCRALLARERKARSDVRGRAMAEWRCVMLGLAHVLGRCGGLGVDRDDAEVSWSVRVRWEMLNKAGGKYCMWDSWYWLHGS